MLWLIIIICLVLIGFLIELLIGLAKQQDLLGDIRRLLENSRTNPEEISNKQQKLLEEIREQLETQNKMWRYIFKDELSPDRIMGRAVLKAVRDTLNESDSKASPSDGSESEKKEKKDK